MGLPLTPVRSLLTAQTQAGGIHLLRLADANARCVDYARDVLDGLDASIFVPATNLVPAFFFGFKVANAVLWIDGTSNLGQAQAQLAGYIGRPLDSWTEPVCDNLAQAAADIFGAIRNGVGDFIGQIHCAGWSYGGAIASVLPIFARVGSYPDATWGVTTFGAPRVGGPQQCRDIRAACDMGRWMNDNDPIPLVPPRVADFPPILPLFGIRGCTRAENFLHPDGGVAIFSDGRVQSNNVPPAGVINFVAGITDWLLASDADPTSPHNIAQYRVRIQAALQRNDGHAREPAPAPERPQANARREISRRAAAVVHQVQELGQVQGDIPVVVPRDKRFVWYKLGGLFITAFGDLTVATSNTKKRARHLANAGNDFLERLQAQAVVDPGALLQQFTNYVELATDPASGFTPTMNTKFPS